MEGVDLSLTAVAAERGEDIRALIEAIDVVAFGDRALERIMHEVFPSRVDDAAFRATVRPSVHDNLQAILGVLAGRAPIGAAEPLGAFALAEMMARLGDPRTMLERGYRIGHWVIWEEWFVLAEEWSREHEVPLRDLVFIPGRMLTAYIDAMVPRVLARYEATRREMDRTRDHVRSTMVRRILDGSVDQVTPDIEQALHYDVALRHRALVLTAASTTVVHDVANALREASGARHALLHQVSVSTWCIWIGCEEPEHPRTIGRMRRVLGQLDLAGALGDAGDGLVGFRRSYEQARHALRVREATQDHTAAIVWYSDVRLEALLLADESLAREFVLAELGSFAGTGERPARLRETIEAWLQTGSHVGAAAVLAVHEQTVRNRLRAVEDEIGSTMLSRRTELAIALRLHRVLNDPLG
ncbi:hypothetical protein DSM112329_03670 [Paraconexibacter sp. AEG42_29]|uniref:PucR family transcriptional regulator n=1 Tax=Paraconexibacter sp. AEG42_29 TaxID=2997339 RepID=A0AAU7AYT9_9ACTN